MKSHEIRDSYLTFFEKRDHRVVASSPVVPQGDPTLLFTNAGMNQFKDLLLGNETRDYTRAASVQKCIRAGGKHNDLDEVGKDGRHLTFFEMLGNWSFGDYYKRDAIIWAWEYCTEVLKLDRSRLYVTIYKDDDDAYAIWADEVGIEPARILRLGDIEDGNEENFWSMGPTGPCGPCTEIHYDLHPERGDFPFEAGYDDERVVEFWNLVFMEFNRDETGELDPLPMQSVDTGMGLDRMAAIQQGVDNVFKTDLFRAIHRRTASLLDQPIEEGEEAWRSFYDRADFTDFSVIADHIRMVTFSLCDGAKFSNEGRGYVLRRVLRRAVRHGRNLGFTGPFLHQVAEAVVETFGPIYPELQAMGAQAGELIKLEEERFFRNIDRGIELFEQSAATAEAEGREEISGEEVFQLHATFGFPPDLTEIMAQERGLGIDWHGYKRLWAEHQETSRGKDVYADAAGVGDWITLHDGPTSEFTGYTDAESRARLMRYRKLSEGRWELVLDRTPFYAESGGQIGDQGSIVSVDGEIEFRVEDTQKAPIGIVHGAKLVRGGDVEGELDGEFFARVDLHRRELTACNHTATHLLHAALRNMVSDGIFQSGSLVAPDRLRFDFSYGEPLTDEQLQAIEDRINTQIRQGHQVCSHHEVERDVAVEKMGAMAIFGEKYGDTVRVVEIPGESVELCGGIHVQNTRDINLFRITSESGVAAGIRRIEAVTNEKAFDSFQRDRALLEELAGALKTNVSSLVDRARHLVEEKGELEKQVEKLSQRLAKADAGDLVDEAEDVDGVKVVARKITVDSRDQLLTYADMLRDKIGEEGVVLLGAEIDAKPALLCLVTDAAFKKRKLKAGDLVNAAASYVDGRGGGRPTLAQAGGSKVEGLTAAVDNFVRIVGEQLKG